MQLQGATELEQRLYRVCRDDAESLPAGEAATRIVVALSDAGQEMQAIRRQRDALLAAIKAGLAPNALRCGFGAQADDPGVCCCGKPKAYHWKSAALTAVAQAGE